MKGRYAGLLPTVGDFLTWGTLPPHREQIAPVVLRNVLKSRRHESPTVRAMREQIRAIQQRGQPR